MDSSMNDASRLTSRIGFHYYPETTRFSDKELAFWLPELQALHASWVVLKSDLLRAIPENFIRGLIQAKINPIIQMNLDLRKLTSPEEVRAVLNAYARWGVKYLQCFSRPNDSSSWTSSSWAQQDLVDRFLDIYLPFASTTMDYGIAPIFPSLKPGGSYWDTAFLKASLESLERRKQTSLLSKLVLSAFACTQGHSLNWGAGGPERWPNARPYLTPGNSEDHRGFRIADWYLSISKSVLGDELPIILFNAGQILPPGENNQTPPANETYAETCLKITKMLLASSPRIESLGDDEISANFPGQVLACNFSPLVMEEDSQFETGWYHPNGNRFPIIEDYLQLFPVEELKSLEDEEFQVDLPVAKSVPPVGESSFHPISHYLLLPTYEWGVADWHLDVIKPFVKKHKPVIGFSMEEAFMARKVTVIGNPQVFPEEELDALRQNGCLVERISGDGTSIATQLSER